MKRAIFLVVLVSLFMMGCAAPSHVVRGAGTTGVLYGEVAEKSVDLAIENSLEPWGILLTEAMVKGNVTVFSVTTAKAEWREAGCLRGLRWNAWAIDSEGVEHFAQALLIEEMVNDKWLDKWVILIDGQFESGFVSIISLDSDEVYNLLRSTERSYQIDAKRLANDSDYRKAVVREKGMAVSGMSRVEALDFLRQASKLHAHIIKTVDMRGVKEVLLLPFTIEEAKAMIGINPENTYSRKFVNKGEMNVYPLSWFGTTVSLAVDAVNGMGSSRFCKLANSREGH